VVVALPQRLTLGGAEEPFTGAEVEDLPAAAEDHRDDPGVTRHPAQHGRGEQLPR